MPGNATFHHRNAALLSVAEVQAPVPLTSRDLDRRLADALKRLKLPQGLLQRVAGVKTRRNWERAGDVRAGTVEAGRRALQAAAIDPADVSVMINTSVTREHLEPSVAVGIHHDLGLPSSAMNFDITNACLGFVNAMTLASSLIDAGQATYVLIVNGEDARKVQDATVERISSLESMVSREDFMSEFASLTLGSGAAAAVVGPADRHPEGHRIVGGVTRAATQHHGLCVGDHRGMYTDSRGLLDGGLELVMDAWQDAKEHFDWESMDAYVTHQVSSLHTASIIKAAKLDKKRVPVTYPELGNVGPASLPITLSREAPRLSPGSRVLCMGVGSGLNTAMVEIAW
ncbi:3-oxoacyl-ACP synthase III [Nesterenkonia sp. HG001]|uniref:3-oxoacyl-ACP synthase III n=1 Tax=Nesterenkonia sp. HG001 TaxID=2983207 RepID=UPI002AC5785E|nr:3-oxoacyl-ACP synthase III [Nesterenkonia sp. HG001]MDZ5078370.1 3-oxoacyl-ACP synthase III [Nesterenkonia sp. HG001]